MSNQRLAQAIIDSNGARIAELQSELRDFRKMYAAQFRENEELKRRLAYAEMPTPKWRGMESADTSGDARAILVYCSERRNTYTAIWKRGEWKHFAAGGEPMTETPTHWMPLPPAPNESTQHAPGGQEA